MRRTYIINSNPVLAVFDIGNESESITCLLCGMTSYHPEDVKNRYCGKCHIFHEDSHGDWT